MGSARFVADFVLLLPIAAKILLHLIFRRKETMQTTLSMIREKFRGADAYVKDYTSLTDDDISQIRKNLLV